MDLPLLPQDKANHFIYGAAIYILALVACDVAGVKYPHDIIAMGAVAVIAVLREVYGYFATKKFDPIDALATLFGGGIIYLARVLP